MYQDSCWFITGSKEQVNPHIYGIIQSIPFYSCANAHFITNQLFYEKLHRLAQDSQRSRNCSRMSHPHAARRYFFVARRNRASIHQRASSLDDASGRCKQDVWGEWIQRNVKARPSLWEKEFCKTRVAARLFRFIVYRPALSRDMFNVIKYDYSTRVSRNK